MTIATLPELNYKLANASWETDEWAVGPARSGSQLAKAESIHRSASATTMQARFLIPIEVEPDALTALPRSVSEPISELSIFVLISRKPTRHVRLHVRSRTPWTANPIAPGEDD
ncbi:hypothetical protein [Planctellipticum variicoloris]|uniref:hypothetical protein n=1 Tax=Planctellipticum variicoloris TaxID=3064265 RepID=UPI0030137FB2|nr:hypothetical protein SH412_003957 [Planctomycetaceae bacterium SH412]